MTALPPAHVAVGTTLYTVYCVHRVSYMLHTIRCLYLALGNSSHSTSLEAAQDGRNALGRIRSRRSHVPLCAWPRIQASAERVGEDINQQQQGSVWSCHAHVACPRVRRQCCELASWRSTGGGCQGFYIDYVVSKKETGTRPLSTYSMYVGSGGDWPPYGQLYPKPPSEPGNGAEITIACNNRSLP